MLGRFDGSPDSVPLGKLESAIDGTPEVISLIAPDGKDDADTLGCVDSLSAADGNCLYEGLYDSVGTELGVVERIRLGLSVGIVIGLELGLDEGDKVVGVNERETLGFEESWVGFLGPDEIDGGNDPTVMMFSRSSTFTPLPCKAVSTLSFSLLTRIV